MQRMVGAPAEAGVLATLGIALILQNTVILVFGGGYKFFSGGYIEPVSVLRLHHGAAAHADPRRLPARFRRS